MVLDAEIFFFLSLSSLCGSWTAWSEESLQNILHLLILHKIELSCLHYGQHRESWFVIEKLFSQGPGEIVWHLPDSLFFTKWSRAHYSAPDCELLEPYEFITDQSILGRVWHSCPMLKNYLSNSHWLCAKLYGYLRLRRSFGATSLLICLGGFGKKWRMWKYLLRLSAPACMRGKL